MNLSGVKEIYAKPNNDGTFCVKVSMECSDQGNCILMFPRAKTEIIALGSNNGGELLMFAPSE